MASGLCLKAFPSAEVWGCPEAGRRHVPLIRIKDSASGFSLSGCQVASFPGSIYNDRWLYFEPAKLLCVGDFVPGIENAIQVASLWNHVIKCLRCGQRCTMMAYQRSLVTNHQDVRDELCKVYELEINFVEGCHPRAPLQAARAPNEKQLLLDYWSWLVPPQKYNLVVGSKQIDNQ